MNDYLEKWCCLIIFIDNSDSSTSARKNNADHVLQIATSVHCTKHIYYKEKVDVTYQLIQRDESFLVEEVDLTLQRQKAFAHAFEIGFRKAILIDGDLMFLESKHLLEAFNSLKIIEFCIGPKKHGGLYLFGMNYLEPAILQNVHWDSSNITKEIIHEIGKLKQALYKLPLL